MSMLIQNDFIQHDQQLCMYRCAGNMVDKQQLLYGQKPKRHNGRRPTVDGSGQKLLEMLNKTQRDHSAVVIKFPDLSGYFSQMH